MEPQPSSGGGGGTSGGGGGTSGLPDTHLFVGEHSRPGSHFLLLKMLAQQRRPSSPQVKGSLLKKKACAGATADAAASTTTAKRVGVTMAVGGGSCMHEGASGLWVQPHMCTTHGEDGDSA